jgi:hypothetical protein
VATAVPPWNANPNRRATPYPCPPSREKPSDLKTNELGTQKRKSLNPFEYGFLWPVAQTLTNVLDEDLAIEPTGFAAGFDEADEIGKMALRQYDTNRGCMTELEIVNWFCGGSAKWMEVLKLFKSQIGLQKTVRLRDVYSRLSRLGVSQEVCDLTILRLVRGKYATLDGIGDNAVFTIVRW